MNSRILSVYIDRFIHGLAYVLLIINLFLMNFNVLMGKPKFVFVNLSLSLLALALCILVLIMRKGRDSIPLFGVCINVYAIIVVVGSLFFYES